MNEVKEKSKAMAVDFFNKLHINIISEGEDEDNIGKFYRYISEPISLKEKKKVIDAVLNEKNASYTTFKTNASGRAATKLIVVYCVYESDIINDNSDKTKVIEKIDKLLKLAGSKCNEHEAALAALKAQQLMKRHHIDTQEIGLKKADMSSLGIGIGVGNPWKLSLANVVARNYCCTSRVNKNRTFFLFTGYSSDALIARRVFQFLYDACKRSTAKYVRECKKAGESHRFLSNTYAIGFVEGIACELDKQCTALQLIISDEVKAYDQELYDPSGTNKTETDKMNISANQKAKSDGFRDGKNQVRATRLEHEEETEKDEARFLECRTEF